MGRRNVVRLQVGLVLNAPIQRLLGSWAVDLGDEFAFFGEKCVHGFDYVVAFFNLRGPSDFGCDQIFGGWTFFF